MIRSILFTLDHDLPGVYNVAGDGPPALERGRSVCGKRTVPLPRSSRPHHRPLAQFGLLDLPEGAPAPAALRTRVDNRRLKDLGFRYEYTSAEAVRAFIEAVRLRRTVGDSPPCTATSATSSSSSATRRRSCDERSTVRD